MNLNKPYKIIFYINLYTGRLNKTCPDENCRRQIIFNLKKTNIFRVKEA